jgi:hypothetical protein
MRLARRPFIRWIAPVARSTRIGAGASSLLTASRLLSRLKAIVEIGSDPGDYDRRAGCRRGGSRQMEELLELATLDDTLYDPWKAGTVLFSAARATPG